MSDHLKLVTLLGGAWALLVALFLFTLGAVPSTPLAWVIAIGGGPLLIILGELFGEWIVEAWGKLFKSPSVSLVFGLILFICFLALLVWMQELGVGGSGSWFDENFEDW